MESNNRILSRKMILIIGAALLVILLLVTVVLGVLSSREKTPEIDASQAPDADVIVPITPMYPDQTEPEQTEEANDVTESADQTEPEGTITSTEPTETEPEGTKATEPTEPEGTKATEPTEPEGTKATEPTEPEGTKPTDPAPTEPAPTEPAPTKPPVDQKPTDQISGGEIVCKDYALFSGRFVEDGRDELVQNVAAILVKNESDQFLDLATISYDIDGKSAAFLVTGLPAGKSAWVMEITRMQASHSSVFTYKDCITSFKSDVVLETDMFSVTADGNMLTATNTSGKTLNNVCVYYRAIHDDGNYFGGITYLADFGTLAPGESLEVLAGHYAQGAAEIIRYGWTDG